MTNSNNYIWYGAYGSNITRIERYIKDRPIDTIEQQWQLEPCHLYFAGKHKNWDGNPVAFVEPFSPVEMVSYYANKAQQSAKPSDFSVFKVFRVTIDEFFDILTAENTFSERIEKDLSFLDSPMYKYFTFDYIKLSADLKDGQYNALLRIGDVLYDGEFEQCYTMTTSLNLEVGTPNQQYVDTIRVGIEQFANENPDLVPKEDVLKFSKEYMDISLRNIKDKVVR